MRCEQVQPLIGAWQDEELAVLTAWRVRRHVRRCAACSAEAAALERMEERLRAAAPLGPEPWVSTTRGRQTWPALAGAAMAVVVAFLVLIRSDHSPTPPIVPTASNPNLSTVNRGPTVTAGSAEAGRPAEGLTSVVMSPSRLKNQTAIAAASERTPVRSRRGRRQIRFRRTGEVGRVVSYRRPRHRGAGPSTPLRRERTAVQTSEPEMLIVAARTLTPVEMVERERDASEFIYVAAIPTLTPPRSVQ
jgi:hypothetical protein